MTFSQKTAGLAKIQYFLLLAIVFIASCGGPTDSGNNAARTNSRQSSVNANSSNGAASNDDTAALAAQILMPIVPEEVKWREEAIRNSDGKKLVAVLKFTAEGAANMIAQASRHRPSEAVVLAPEDWFPEELVAQSQLAGDDSLRGDAYAASDFLQLPYKNGRLVKIENSNYFVLELSTQ